MESQRLRMAVPLTQCWYIDMTSFSAGKRLQFWQYDVNTVPCGNTVLYISYNLSLLSQKASGMLGIVAGSRI